jgi:hypothetical protein
LHTSYASQQSKQFIYITDIYTEKQSYCNTKVPVRHKNTIEIPGKVVLFPGILTNTKTMQSIVNKTISRIYDNGRGWAFSSNDFVDIYSKEQIDSALSYLAKNQTIRRVCRGIYDYPRYSALLEQILSPDIDQLAQAFARKFNWRIQPTGDAALNLLGLSTQVPGRFKYLSDGPNRTYNLGNQTLEFEKSALKNFGFKHRESGLLVQAIKALGKNHISNTEIEKVRKQLDLTKSKQIIKDTRLVTAWIHDYIKLIYSGN